MRNPFESILPPVRAVTLIVTSAIDIAWSLVQTWGNDQADTSRVVLCQWTSPPAIDRLIDDVVGAFADVALAEWPHWYGLELVSTDGSAFERNLDLRLQLKNVSRSRPHVVMQWLKRSAAMCLVGKRPFDSYSGRELQAGQLSLAVCPDQLTIVLCVASPEATGGEAVVAAAEWFHRVTGANVIILIPQSWCGSPEMDRHRLDPLVVQVDLPTDGEACVASAFTAENPSIAGRMGDKIDFGASPPGTPTSSSALTSVPTRTSAIPGAQASSRPSAAEGVAVSVTPLTGRPHPGSVAEQALFKRIQSDAELAPLLKFNQSVRVDLMQKYRVDVVCERRRVAIEIDGDDHRVSAAKYSSDCERDYRLMKHGFVVLRLPNDLVVGDMEIALARIRDIVRYRKDFDGGQ